MNGMQNMANRSMKILYLCVALFLIGVFLILLYQPVQAAFHEQDLWWMMPLMSSITEGHSFLENIKLFLFNPYPTLQGDPWMNTYLSSVIAIFGVIPKYFIFVSIVFHFLCAILLYAILRKLDFDYRIAFFSALVYLTTFVNFCYYIWPMAFHHLFVLFISLLVMYFYFDTNKRADSGDNWKISFWITIFLNFLASFSQITILLLPIGILAHILIASKDGEERLKKYNRWLPIFIIYLGYPVIRFVYFGYQHLERFFHIGIGAHPVTNAVLFPAILFVGIGFLFLFGGILQLLRGYKLDRIFKILCITSLGLYLLILVAAFIRHDLVLGPHKAKLYELLSPYSFIYPFCVTFMNFIAPIKAALSINSTVPYNMIPLQSNIAGDLLSLLLIIVFIKKYFLRYKGLVIIAIFYIAALRYMRVDTANLPSRHFVYVVPFFSIIFCSSFIYLYDLISNKISFNKKAREIILALIFIGLCVPNVFAIKLEMFRGRMANTFLIYDYIKISNLVKDDILANEEDWRVKARDIYIKGIRPMPFNVDEYWYPSADSHLRFDSFRYVFTQVYNNRPAVNLIINKTANAKGEFEYAVKDLNIYNSTGLNIDKFDFYFDKAVKELRLGNNKKAFTLFKEAINIRPFLLNYVLSGGYELKDLGRIMGRKDLKSWVGDIINYYTVDSRTMCFKSEMYHAAKRKYVSSIIEKEMNEYIECLFYAAYLEYIFGNTKESNALLSEIAFIESDRNAVVFLLSKASLIRSSDSINGFITKYSKGIGQD